MTSAEFVQHLLADARLAVYLAGVALVIACVALAIAAIRRRP